MRALKWPTRGVSYTYANHPGYKRPEKLKYWLEQTFAEGESMHRIFSGYIYVKSLRQPTDVSTLYQTSPLDEIVYAEGPQADTPFWTFV